MAGNSFAGLRKLEDFSCEIKPSNNEEPDPENCVLHFKLENNSSSNEIDMVISKPSLDMLLDGLHKIQSQLNNVATKSKA